VTLFARQVTVGVTLCDYAEPKKEARADGDTGAGVKGAVNAAVRLPSDRGELKPRGRGSRANAGHRPRTQRLRRHRARGTARPPRYRPPHDQPERKAGWPSELRVRRPRYQAGQGASLRVA
jgi:hypothetical protein